MSTILALCGTRFKSPTVPNLTEWVVCDKPLGAWGVLWVLRAALATWLAKSEFQWRRRMYVFYYSPWGLGLPGVSLKTQPSVIERNRWLSVGSHRP